MTTLNQAVPAVGPLTAAQLTAEINTELAELYKRSFATVGSAAGTNAYTGGIPLNRPLENDNGFIMVVPNGNTGPCTFNGKPLVSNEGTALQSGQLSTGMVIAFVYKLATDDYRILTPLSGGAAPIVRTYIANATWNKPAGLRYISVQVQAAGGKGGRNNQGSAGPNGGGGGGAGGYSRRTIAAADLPASVTVSISAPGTAGSANFGSFMSAPNGSNGAVGSGTSPGAVTASPTGGDINIPGGAGQAGGTIGTSPATRICGAGANSMMGQGGAQRIIAANSIDGLDPSGFGAGGGGCALTTTGTETNGGPGIVIVEEYY
jgi:hypothetical protein